MSKERDLVIQEKLKDLEQRKGKLEISLEECSKDYKTNLTLTDDCGKKVNLRVVSDVKELVDKYFAQLLVKAESIVESHSLILGEKCTREDMIVCEYPFRDWISDFTKLTKKIRISEEIEKVKKAIRELPEFYTSEKKDEDRFNDLLNSVM
jgi:hypothetical protein